MLLSGERVAMRMLKFILVARITATLSKQTELDASDYGVRSARRRSCYDLLCSWRAFHGHLEIQEVLVEWTSPVQQ
jgi:hypothetical protein